MRAAGMAFNWSLSSARVDLRLPERQKIVFFAASAHAFYSCTDYREYPFANKH